MENYKKIAFRYLKMNRHRSIVTILGVTAAVMILYLMLNTAWAFLLNTRDQVRETEDYEIVLFTENQTQIETIIKDPKVKSAYVGPFYDYDYYNPVAYETALYINTTNPYQMDSYMQYFMETYSLGGQENYNLAYTYMQGGSGNSVFILFMFIILVSYIFAIFGVGIIRNSIQLTLLERIKDFGNLRCIGATKGQLKAVIYLQGAVLELGGIACGTVVGLICSLMLGAVMKWGHMGFHFIPLIPILIAFLGDLYFAMNENAKLITNMTPVSAIRGEYRIKGEKIKARRRSLAGRLFGIEGDYAYKNLKRNPSRFRKTIAVLSLGIAALMGILGVTNTLGKVQKQALERWGYYHIFFEVSNTLYNTEEEMIANLPSMELLEKSSKMKNLADAKQCYQAQLIMTDIDRFYDTFSKDFLTETYMGDAINERIQTYKSGNIDNLSMILCIGLDCRAYDQADMKRYQSDLVAGTLDVSDHGVILVNGGIVDRINDVGDAIGYTDTNYTSYQVGDTIEILDMKQYRKEFSERIKPFLEDYERKKELVEQKYPGAHIDETDAQASADYRKMEDELTDLSAELQKARMELVLQIRKELMEAGAYQSYTIEGIVKRDTNHISLGPSIVVPKERFSELSGMSEHYTSGMMYHFDKISVTEYYRACSWDTMDEMDMSWLESGYIWDVELIKEMKYFTLGFLLVVLFVVMMSVFNIINTSASNLHMRRKELAQLRALGVSRKGLYRIVMLEGVISSVIAGVLGVLLGFVSSYLLIDRFVKFVYACEYEFPIMPAILGVLVSTLVLCGSLYAPLKQFPQDIAEDLTTAGE